MKKLLRALLTKIEFALILLMAKSGLVYALAPVGTGNPEVIGEIKVVQGVAWVYPYDESPRVIALKGMPIHRGDYILTEKDAIEIHTRDDSTIRVMADSFLKFGDRMALMRGAALVKNGKFETPHAYVEVENYGWAHIRTQEAEMKTQVMALKPGVKVSQKFDLSSFVRLDSGQFSEVGVLSDSLKPEPPKGVDVAFIKLALDSYGILETDREQLEKTLEKSVMLWAKNELPASLEVSHGAGRSLASIHSEKPHLAESSKKVEAIAVVDKAVTSKPKYKPLKRALASHSEVDDLMKRAESARLQERESTLKKLRQALLSSDDSE